MLRADNLTTFVCRLSWNMGALTSWKSQGLSRPVIGLLYLYEVFTHHTDKLNVALLTINLSNMCALYQHLNTHFFHDRCHCQVVVSRSL